MPYKKPQTKKRVRVSAGAKGNIPKRVEAGSVIATNSPNSAILQQNADVKQAAANLGAVNVELDAKDTLVKAIETQLATERNALATVDWDSLYDVFVSTARLYCATAEDATSLGLAATGPAIYSLAMPISVSVKWDVERRLIRIRVQRAPGLRAVRIEISPDPMTATSFMELDGDGSTAALAGYAPGTYWVRAAMVRARERSELTTPVSVIVK
jgi:hypothetical protein